MWQYLAAADQTVTDMGDTMRLYFMDNIGVILGVVVAIACVLFMLRMLFGMVGIRRGLDGDDLMWRGQRMRARDDDDGDWR